MKVIKILLAIIIAISVTFLGLGIFVPSYEYQVEASILASPDKCWSIFNDTSRMKEWMTGFKSLTLKEGQIRESGSKYEIVIEMDGKRYVMQEELKEFTPPSRAIYELHNDVLKSEYEYSFVGQETTIIKSHYRITGNNIIWRSILLLSKSYMKEQSQQQLENLKKAIEGGR